MTDNNENNNFTEQETNYSDDNQFEGLNPTISPIAAAFIGLIGGFFLYQFVGGLLTLAIFGFDLESASVTGLRLMTAAGQILFILLPALIFARLVYYDVGKIIRANQATIKEILLFSVGVIIFIPLLQSYLYIQNHFIHILAENSAFVSSIKSFFDMMNELVEKTYGNLLRADNAFEMIFVFVVIAVVPALSEEVMFRGYVQKSFELKMNPLIAALITAIAFGLYHFNPYGLLPLIALGFFFGYAAYKSGSILVPIVLHFLNNFFAVALFYFVGDDELLKSNIEPVENLGGYFLMFIGLCLMFVIFIIIVNRFYDRRKENASMSTM